MTERIQPEEIGALLDGRVSEPRRAELLAVLATADEDFQLFIDTAAVLREAEEEEAEKESEPVPVDTPAPAPRVIPIDRGRRRWWRTPVAGGLAAAAVLAALALVPAIRARLHASAWDDPSRVTTMAWRRGADLPEKWEAAFGGTRRGGGTAAANTGATARIGVRLVDLEIAAAAADFDRASLFAGQIAAFLGDIQGAGPLVAQYDAIAEAARSHDPRLTDLVKNGREDVSEFAKASGSGDYLGLGAWTEAARLATARQAAAFFRAPESRGAVDRAVGMGLSGAASEAAARLRSVVHDGAEIRDWPALRRDLDSLQSELTR